MINNIGSILVGFKIATIISSYIGAGAFSKWVIDVWYPATRAFWGAFTAFFYFPDLSNFEKDCLTATVLFAPFGFSAMTEAYSKYKYIEKGESLLKDRFLSLVLGACFMYIVCESMIY